MSDITDEVRAVMNGEGKISPRQVLRVAAIRRQATLDLSDPKYHAFGYDGGQITVWTNPPGSLFEQSREKEPDGAAKPDGWLLQRLILDWNLADADGRVLPISLESLRQ